MLLAAIIAFALALLVAVSAERQLRMRGGPVLAAAVGAVLGTAVAGALTGVVGAVTLGAAVAGAVAGIGLGRRA